MAESTLSLEYRDFISAIADYMGDGADFDALQEKPGKFERAHGILNSAYRKFLHPQTVRSDGRVHRWKFLRPITTISTVEIYNTGTIEIASGVVTLTGGTWPTWMDTQANGADLNVNGTTYTIDTKDTSTQATLTDLTVTVASGTSFTLGRSAYDLPDDYGGLDGPLTYQPGTAQLYGPIDIVDESMIRVFRQDYDTYTLRPKYAAQRRKTHDATTGTRWELLFWPTPDAVYTLSYKYKSNPNELDETNKYPVGGLNHAETLLQGCLAEAERRMEDSEGVHQLQYARMLQASIEIDRDANAPEFLGQDGSTYHAESGQAEILTTRSWGAGGFVTYQGHNLFTG